MIGQAARKGGDLMDMPGWFYCDLYSFFLLLFIFVNVFRSAESRERQSTAYFGMLVTTMLLLALDVFIKFAGQSGSLQLLEKAAVGLSFALGPLCFVFWMRYIGCTLFPGNENHADKWVYTLFVLFLANAALALLSIPFGWVFYFDNALTYHRGPLFPVPMLVLAVTILFPEFFIFTNRDRIEPQHLFTLHFFLIPPLICGVLQTLHYGSSLALSGLSFSELIVFVHIQTGSINVDYLTGAYNRRKLDRQMHEKIQSSSAGHTFAAVLIDLDNFKMINDTMGHNVGDAALCDVVSILRESIRANDLLARYGGDEFCIVLECTSNEELETVVHRIETRLARFNASCARPYLLSFSMGYHIYDVHSHMNVHEFQKQLDDLMYEHKRHHHIVCVNEEHPLRAPSQPDNPSDGDGTDGAAF